MFSGVRRVSAALICLFLAMMASGYFSTLISVEIQQRGYNSLIVGLVSSAYYAGLILGCFRVERFIAKVGYVRAYATFAAFSVILALLQGFYLSEPFVSLVLRFFFGTCVGVFFVILEGWVMAASTPKNRGSMMAICMITLYSGYSLGQFFMVMQPENGLIPFMVIAILLSLSIIPLAAVRQEDPGFSEPSRLSFKDLYFLTPTGMLGCFLTGAAFSTIYSIFPIMFERLNYSRMDLSLAMFTVIFGGMFLQYPLGRLSDVIGRWKVLVFLGVATFFLLVCAIFFYEQSTLWSLGIFFLLGGACYPLYPIVLSHAGDVIAKQDMTAAMQGFVIMYAIGCTIGPIFSSSFMQIFGPIGVIFSLMIIMLLLAGIFLWRKQVGVQMGPKKQKDFVPASSGTLFFVKKKKETKK